MRVFIYEFFTGGGACAAPNLPAPSLLREGAAMLRAIVDDFAALLGVEVVTTRDVRLAELELSNAHVIEIGNADDERAALERLGRECDAVLLIGPEFEGILWQRATWLEQCGARLISPSAEFIAIAADKALTAVRLTSRNVPAPRGWIITKLEELPPDFRWPAILKPRDGAGSLGVRLVHSRDELVGCLQPGLYLEEFCPGRAASCAVICGPGQLLPLPACEQLLAGESGFEYRGGTLPLAPERNERAQRLAVRAIECLPKCVGYCGVDLVLGEAADGSEDFVIEINPRLTTSYIGLRALCRENLARVMLSAASGRSSALSQRAERVEFTAEGTISRSA